MVGKGWQYIACVLVAAGALLSASMMAQAAEVWQTATAPQLVYFVPSGAGIKVKVGGTATFRTGCDDIDTYTNGSLYGEEKTTGYVRYSVPANFGTLSNVQLVLSQTTVTWTAPAEVPATNPQNLSVYGDDNQEGDRDDAETLLKTLPITVVTNCPTSVTLDNTCPYTEAVPHTLGGTRAKMKANPDNEDWDGYAIVEEVSLGAGSSCTLDDFIAAAGITQLANLCYGNGTFTVGEGTVAEGGCAGTAEHNRFYDTHVFRANVAAVLKDGHGPCTIVCSQVYKCGGQNVGSFTITKTLTNTGANKTSPTVVTITKQSQ